MGLALDQFMASIRNEHIQDILLQSPPKTLDGAHETAKRLEAAQAAWKWLCSRRKWHQVNTLRSSDKGQKSAAQGLTGWSVFSQWLSELPHRCSLQEYQDA